MLNSTIDAEIKKFSKLATDWWLPNGKFKVLHEFNNTRVEFIKNSIIKHCDSKMQNNNIQILDIGSGGGILSESFAKMDYSVTGIDASLESVEAAIKHAQASNLNIKYIHSSLDDFKPKQLFDVVFATEVIEHVSNPSFFIKQALDLLNNNGLIFIATINRNIKSLILAKFMAEYVLQWLPKNTHEFSKFVTPSEVNAIMNKYNVNLEEISGIKFNLLKKSWNLTTDTSVNYICVYKKNASL